MQQPSFPVLMAGEEVDAVQILLIQAQDSWSSGFPTRPRSSLPGGAASAWVCWWRPKGFVSIMQVESGLWQNLSSCKGQQVPNTH